ncbi:hypothetical protein FB567DRAFT_518041 [Paraphoma chrysanthemicola]|uniref:Uncharacterized protein n=1 Tax=Paraphoma chrysanthemicola TaxID=798071 RepID=A0A8K0RBH7_9PLEO|nr:hypothetical protein FB567DRAFT_518041 [Paraphoma chrysanthemicola]
MSSSTFETQLKAQWSNPGDILSVLLIVGADVIGTALAQFNGQSFKPVAFSFGWVAYAYTYLLKTAGRLKSTPDPDLPHLLVNCRSGYVRENSSWILGRILHHREMWMPETWKSIRKREMDDPLVDRSGAKIVRREFVISIFEPSFSVKQGVPTFDRVPWTGVVVAILQLGIAAIPCGLYRQWDVLVVTACGTTLAWLMGLLEARSNNTRKDTNKTFALTTGNGSRDVIVILGNGRGLDLEDLASEIAGNKGYTAKLISAILMVLMWTGLLITTAGMKSNTWYLLAIGGIGMLQNIYVAGARRRPGAYGIHLDLKECITNRKVMQTLMETEEKYPRVGKSLLTIFFPGKLRDAEVEWWEQHGLYD